jgi:sugar lactone lactonase YvrE
MSFAYVGDGGPAKDALFHVDETPVAANFGIALSRENPPARLYVADSGNHCIRAVHLLESPPTIELVAGTPTRPGFRDGPAREAMFNFPTNVVVDAAGRVYVSDTKNSAIRRIDAATGEVTTIAGTGVAGFNGDNRPATDAKLNRPHGVAIHPDGRIFIADTDNNRVRVIQP